MCGIAGYTGPRNAAPVILDCLKRLEYRGYDSCGIGLIDGESIYLARRTGRIDPFCDEVLRDSPRGKVGLGHTRWATHGRADILNAHPHVSCDEAILVVHNGTIDNSEELRDELETQGHRFRSQTDSEVIPHILEERTKQGESFDQAVVELRTVLRGSYALLIGRRGSLDLYAMRKGSPLVIGVGETESEFFPASDIPSFLPLTKSVIYLDDSSNVVLTRSGMYFLEGEKGAIRRTHRTLHPQTVSLDASNLSKQGFDHYMIKEILEQVDLFERFARLELEPLEKAARLLHNCHEAWLVGAGSSYHACQYGDWILSALTTCRTTAHISSELEFREEHLRRGAVVVAVSQSGETADTLDSVVRAASRDASIVAITDAPLSQLGRMADVVIPLHAGTELAVAATKSYTSQLSVFLRLAYHIAGNDAEGRRQMMLARDGLLNLTSDSARAHTLSLAQSLQESKSVFLVGRGPHRVTASEAALKLKEVAGIHAESFAGGEMKHGPLALIEEGTPVLFFYDDLTEARAGVAAGEVHSRGGLVFSIGPRPLSTSTNHIRVDEAGIVTPLIQVVPMQLLSYELALLRGLDPDHPRNLAKAVTVI